MAPTSLKITFSPRDNQLLLDVRREAGRKETHTQLEMDLRYHLPTSRFVDSFFIGPNFSKTTNVELHGVQTSVLARHMNRLCNLRRLVIKDGGRLDPLIKELGRFHNGRWTCPKLVALAIKQGSTYSQDCLLETVRARYQSAQSSLADGLVIPNPSPLKCLIISFRTHGPDWFDMLDINARDQIRQIVGDGVFHTQPFVE
ncbi:hypothetical protein FRC03_007922 [Tulasnella sp. 419]|nr:hypothetical protein FRC03_007922 [Tulasnella sp. 419]